MVESAFSQNLRTALERDGWSQLRLVKELASRTGNAVESERSAVRGYLRGSTPRPERAALIAEILGRPDLAVVENPRQSGAARLEGRLGAIENLLASILETQQTLLKNQDEMFAQIEVRSAEIQRLREGVESLAQASPAAPKRSRGQR